MSHSILLPWPSRTIRSTQSATFRRQVKDTARRDRSKPCRHHRSCHCDRHAWPCRAQPLTCSLPTRPPSKCWSSTARVGHCLSGYRRWHHRYRHRHHHRHWHRHRRRHQCSPALVQFVSRRVRPELVPGSIPVLTAVVSVIGVSIGVVVLCRRHWRGDRSGHFRLLLSPTPHQVCMWPLRRRHAAAAQAGEG